MELMKRQEQRDPFWDFEDLNTRLQRLFHSLARPFEAGERESMSLANWAPAVNIAENKTAYVITAELPGIKREDVKVTLDDGVLCVEGERKEEKEQKDATLHRREVSYGHFARRFSVPPDADPGKIDATFKDGMLNVVISKSASKQKPAREIAIH